MELSPEHVTRALDRILESTLFAKAERQRRFLRYIVERQQARDEASLPRLIPSSGWKRPGCGAVCASITRRRTRTIRW
jgi:hypothetical protein